MRRATTDLISPPTWTATESDASKLHIWRMGRHVPTFHMDTSCRVAEMPARTLESHFVERGTVMIRRRTLFGVTTGLLAAKARAQSMIDAPIATTAHGPVRGA